MAIKITTSVEQSRNFRSCEPGLLAATQCYISNKGYSVDTEINIIEVINDIGIDYGLHCTAFSLQGMTPERINWGLLVGAELAERTIDNYDNVAVGGRALRDCITGIYLYTEGKISRSALDGLRKDALKLTIPLTKRSSEILAVRAVYCAAGEGAEDLYAAARFARKSFSVLYPREGCCTDKFTNTAEEEEANIQSSIVINNLLP